MLNFPLFTATQSLPNLTAAPNLYRVCGQLRDTVQCSTDLILVTTAHKHSVTHADETHSVEEVFKTIQC